MKKEILNVNGLCKTFTLSRRQQKIERTHEKKIRAVDHLSFTAYEGEIFGLLGPNGEQLLHHYNFIKKLWLRLYHRPRALFFRRSRARTAGVPQL